MTAAASSPVYDLDDLVQRMNALARKSREKPRWNRWNARRLLEAGGVQFIQRGARCKLYVTLSALREAFPEYVDSLLLAEALHDESHHAA